MIKHKQSDSEYWFEEYKKVKEEFFGEPFNDVGEVMFWKKQGDSQ